MLKIAETIMKSQIQASLICSFFALLSFIFTPFVFLSAATIALVTLRKGTNDSAVVIISSIAILTLFGYASLNTLYAGLLYLFVWLPTLMAASALRISRQLAVSIGSLFILSIAVIILAYLWNGDPTLMWASMLQSNTEFIQILDKGIIQIKEMNTEQIIMLVSKAMTGVVGVIFMVINIIGILIARWWQALLYNPGGFQKDFHNLMINRQLAYISIVIFIVMTISNGMLESMMSALLSLSITLFLFQGLSLFHATVMTYQANNSWLVMLYVLLIFALPQMISLLSIIGFVDTFANFRQRFNKKTHN
ncbi:MAG: DUF2232 domain-containing protein [Methylococcales bacterium]|jgi:hypothetical protein|nr:DUF2232 domain-containing protein [Methylococcales bacterium]